MTSPGYKGKTNTQSLFVPPRGGDLTLRSSDGFEFLVHSTALKLASSVFDDMIATSTTKDTVELAENANDVSYLLRFVYPNKFPVSIDLDELPNCISVIRKYDIEGALEIIEEIILLDGPPHKPLSSDPIRIYELAVQFDLTKTKAAAAPLIAACPTNFCDLTKLPELSRTYPSLRLIRMMNLQAMRSRILSDVLFNFKDEPMLPETDLFYDISCSKCWHPARFSYATEACKKSPTTWSLAWARLAYETLLARSLETSEFLFEAAVLQKFAGDPLVCTYCLSSIREDRMYQEHFQEWAVEVKKQLERKLKMLESLYVI